MSHGERDFGPFKLVRRVAVGGMAEVHLARTKGATGDDKYVAIKMIHPNFAEDEQFIMMLVDEAKIAVQLNHDNIAHTFDLGRVGDTYYITMEYVNGADLYKILRTASEKDVYLPFDCAAAIAQGVASGLDYAHRKRDANGTPLGIVHRDVSPQNVLVSYSGEVKLVDFGIAKAALKEQQTAAGVIKGKYYYMSPEQAWGDAVDLRSDIFSAGIVLYEMITGQMLYLEEHLHKLLEMVRKADIAPPSTIRRDCPPELERIAMQALKKNPHERYQRAADMAVDLERFLQSHAPQFSSGKLVQLLKQTVGEPLEVAAPVKAEERGGPTSTQPLAANDLLRQREELQDENSVLFRISDLKPTPLPQPVVRPAVAAPPVAAPPKSLIPKIGGPSIPSVRRPGDTKSPVVAGAIAGAPARPARPRDPNDETREIDSRDAEPPRSVPRTPAPVKPAPAAVAPVSVPAPKNSWVAANTVANAPPDMGTHPFLDDEEEDRGERTLITGPGFSMADLVGDSANDDNVETVDRGLAMEETRDFDPNRSDVATSAVDINAHRDDDDFAGGDDQPTLAREGHQITARKPAKASPPPAALAATNPTPSISELRKPRPSRRTPAEGVASTAAEPSVLQALVRTNNNNAPMPSTRPSTARPAALPLAPPNVVTPFAVATQPPAPPPTHAAGPAAINPYATGQQSGPYGAAPTPPQMNPYSNPYATGPQQLADNPFATGAQPMPVNAYNQAANPYATGQQQAAQSPYATGQQQAAQNPYATGQQQANPYMTGPQPVANPYPQGAYGQNPYATGQQPFPNQYGQPQYGAPQYPFAAQSGAPQANASLQMMQLDVDELPAHYRIDNKRPKTVLVVLAGIAAISLAAFATFFIVKSTRKAPAVQGSVRVDSVPAGAAVSVDGNVLPNITPLTINNLPAGTSHDLVLTLTRHKKYTTKIEVPKTGGVIPVTAIMTPITGTLRVTSIPPGAELHINGQFRNRTPCTISDVDMEGVKQIELRLKEYTPQKVQLNWPEKAELDVEVKMTK